MYYFAPLNIVVKSCSHVNSALQSKHHLTLTDMDKCCPYYDNGLKDHFQMNYVMRQQIRSVGYSFSMKENSLSADRRWIERCIPPVKFTNILTAALSREVPEMSLHRGKLGKLDPYHRFGAMFSSPLWRLASPCHWVAQRWAAAWSSRRHPEVHLHRALSLLL